jgi:hypothetical protein
MRFLRPFLAVTVLALTAAPAAVRAEDSKESAAAPALVVRLKSINGLLADIKYLAKHAGQEEMLNQFEPIVKMYLESIDATRPIAIYGNVNANDLQQSTGVILVPVADEKAFVDALGVINIKPEKGSDGIYTVENVPNVPVPLYFRFANKYAYITGQNKEALAEKNILAPEKVLPAAGDNSLLSAQFRLSALPDQLKQIALAGLDNQLAQEKEKSVENETPALKAFRMKMIDFMGSEMKAIITDGDELSIRLGVDQKNDDINVDISFTAKKGSTLAKQMEASAKTKTLFAGLASDNAAVRFTAALALPEDLRKMLGPLVDDAVADALKKEADPNKAKAAKTILEAVAPTIKAGELDAGLSLVGPGSDGQYTLIGGVKVVNGIGIEKAIREVHSSLPEKEKANVVLDATTVGDLKVHKIIPESLDENAKKMFGADGIYFTFRDEAFLIAAGPDALKSIKAAASAQPTSSPTLAKLEVSVGRAAGLDPNNPNAAKVAREVFGKNPKGTDTINVTVEMGDALKVKVSAKAKIIEFGAKQAQGKE